MKSHDQNGSAPPARKEQFTVRAVDGGFRVASSLSPSTQFIVSGLPDRPACTCSGTADGLHYRHIEAVLEMNGRTVAAKPAHAPKSTGNGPRTMVVKRSVSPDGRIDSLSVELSLSLQNSDAGSVKSEALW